MGRRGVRGAFLSAVIGAALVTAVAAGSAPLAKNVPVLTGTWDITTKVLANSDTTGWLGPTYAVGSSSKRTWRFEQPCVGADCKTDLVRVTDVSQAKTRIAYRGGNEFAWQENLMSPDTCKGKTFTGLTVRTSFVMKVKTVPVPTGRPFATSLEAVGSFVATINVAAYVAAGCTAPAPQIEYTIRYTGTSPEEPPRSQVFGGPAAGFRPGTVKLPGSKIAVPVTPGLPIPRGSVFDVSNGRAVTLADPRGAATVLYGERGSVPGAFVYTGVVRGVAELRLAGGSFAACAAGRPVRRVWAKGKGKFRTRGRYASTAGATSWLTSDECGRTVVQVKKGTASVRDLLQKKTVVVRPGSSYSAGP